MSLPVERNEDVSENKRVRRIFEKIDDLRRKVSVGKEDYLDFPGLTEDGKVYSRPGSEGVRFEDTLNGKLISSQLKQLGENCGKLLENEALDRSLDESRIAYRKRIRSSPKTYASSDTDPLLTASKEYLLSHWYLRPSLHSLVWQLSAAFRRKAAQVFQEFLPAELTTEDVDARKGDKTQWKGL